MITITKGQAVEALTEAVKDRGADYVYHKVAKEDGYLTCVYTDADSNPSCLVGSALANLGVPLEVLHAIDWGGAVEQSYNETVEAFVEEWGADGSTPPEIIEEDENGIWYRTSEGMSISNIDDGSIRKWLALNDIYLDEGAVELLMFAQREQDGMSTWGKAVTTAIEKTVSVVK